MRRVEITPRLESSVDIRDPLSQDNQSRSSSEGGNSTHKVNCRSSALTTMERTTPTLPENAPSVMEVSHELRCFSTPLSPLLSEQRRLSSSLPGSTSIVEALFGPGLGPCWGDFSCTYSRIRGRLYATSQAVLFYTNLLGFERRICLLLRDVQNMELFRTTSLRFSTRDDETYIFKSFNNREQVLHLLSGLKILVDKQREEKRQALGNSTPSGTVRRNSERPSLAPQRVTSGSGGSFSPSNSLTCIPPSPHNLSFLPNGPLTSNRRRAASDSILRLPRVESSGSVESRNHGESDVNSILSDVRTGEEATAEREDEEENAEASLSSIWQKAKQPMSPFLTELGIDALVLPCDVDTFFQKFLADHAEHSMEYYQRDYVKDDDVKMTGWDLGSDGYFRRTLQFRHPIQNSLGLGPSAADTTRHQKLRHYGGLGIVFENQTHVAGIPAADCFYVQDQWVLESLGENKVQLTVRYDTRFSKRSMFKSIITKSIRKETKEWMAGYVDMIQTVLAEMSSHHTVNSRNVGISHPVPSLETQKLVREAIQSAYRLLAVVSIAFFMLGLLVCFHLYRLQQAVFHLHGDLQQLHFCLLPNS